MITFKGLLTSGDVCGEKDQKMISEFLSKMNAENLPAIVEREQKVLLILNDYCDKLLVYMDFLAKNRLREILQDSGLTTAIEETVQALKLIKVSLNNPGISYLSAIRLFEEGEIVRCTLNCFHTELLLAFLLDSCSNDHYSKENEPIVNEIRGLFSGPEVVFCTYNDMCNVCEPFIEDKFRSKRAYVYSIEEHTGSEYRHDERSNISKIALGTKFCWESFRQPFGAFLSKVIKPLNKEFSDFKSVGDFISYCRKFEEVAMPAKQLANLLGYINSNRFFASVEHSDELLNVFLQQTNNSIRAKSKSIAKVRKIWQLE